MVVSPLMGTFSKSLTAFVKIVNESGKKLRDLIFRELKMLVKAFETIADFLGLAWKLILQLVTLLVFVLVLYFYARVSHDVLIIDSFSVPKQFEEAGFTPDVVANRIGNTMQEINADAHAQIEKNEVTWARDEGSIPDVEVPGTKLGLKTLTEIARAASGAHKSKHVVGDIVALQTGGQSSAKIRITVTIYLKDNQGSHVIRFVPETNDIDLLTREIAEKIWEQVQPYVLASYQYEHRNLAEALKLAQRIIADEPPENSQVAAAYALVGKILSDQHNYAEAVANCKKSIDLNPKSAFPYIVWCNALASQGNDLDNPGNHLAAERKFDEAIERYKEAIEINMKSPVPHNNWGNTLRYEKNFDEADALYKKAIKIDPKFVPAYNNRGLLFYRQKKYSQAIEQYQRANDIDPRLADHKLWEKVLFADKQYDAAIAQYQKAVELDPNAVNGYNYWGDALTAEKKYHQAIEQYKKAIEIKSNDADAYNGWGNALREQGKSKAAEEKFAKARELD
jgi:tetratricopeptide (TPR) repeat protein